MERIKLLKVHFLPKELQEGVLYVSEEFGVAGHLCPCGCKSKVITPLDATEWSFKEVNGRPTLFPSIGNWELPCQSHYWVTNGNIEWSYKWSEDKIIAGQKDEDRRRKSYYESLEKKQVKKPIFRRIFDWIFNR
jgi:hypothetical protein